MPTLAPRSAKAIASGSPTWPHPPTTTTSRGNPTASVIDALISRTDYDGEGPLRGPPAVSTSRVSALDLRESKPYRQRAPDLKKACIPWTQRNPNRLHRGVHTVVLGAAREVRQIGSASEAVAQAAQDGAYVGAAFGFEHRGRGQPAGHEERVDEREAGQRAAVLAGEDHAVAGDPVVPPGRVVQHAYRDEEQPVVAAVADRVRQGEVLVPHDAHPGAAQPQA